MLHSTQSTWREEMVNKLVIFFAQSAGAVEYTDCFSAEG